MTLAIGTWSRDGGSYRSDMVRWGASWSYHQAGVEMLYFGANRFKFCVKGKEPIVIFAPRH